MKPRVVVSVFVVFLTLTLGSLLAVASKTAMQGSAFGQRRAAAVNVGVVAAKPAIPAVGIAYTLGQLWGLINTSNRAQTSSFLLPTLNGKIITHEQCWPAQGVLLNGSVSAGRVNFGGVVVNKDWVAANQNLRVQLNADPVLVSYLTRTKRLTRAAGLEEQYGQILLYFVLQIGGVNYRFYLNDPFPGKIKGKNFPARSIINKWDYQRSFRP